MRIGILGAGQLGMMLAEAHLRSQSFGGQAGHKLDREFRFLDPSPDAPARNLGEFVQAPYTDEEALLSFAHGLDVITYEFENVPSSSAELLMTKVPVFPHPRSLSIAQDRLNEKTFFNELGISTPQFSRVDSLEDLHMALQDTGFPAVLKTRREGYDGKGQIVIKSESDVEAAFTHTSTPLSVTSQALILEGFVQFDREVSIIAVRSKTGEIVYYPLIENVHRDGILRTSRVPANVSPGLQKKAESYARLVLEKLEYVGVLTIELFQKGDELLANEMAPRVHNSGHLTIEAAETSQFENHLRAITGMPLGPTNIPKPAGMVNLIGSIPEGIDQVSDVHLHLYGKAPRPGRKLGHVTVVGNDVEGKLQEIESLVNS